MSAFHGRCAALTFAILVGLGSNDAAAIFIASEPWVRPAASARSTEAYVELTSTEGATLVGARSDAAESIELLPPGTSREPIRAINLPPGERVLLAPKAKRFVLRGLNRTLKLGDRVPIILIVQAADGSQREIAVNAEVRQRSPTDDHRNGHRH